MSGLSFQPGLSVLAPFNCYMPLHRQGTIPEACWGSRMAETEGLTSRAWLEPSLQHRPQRHSDLTSIAAIQLDFRCTASKKEKLPTHSVMTPCRGSRHAMMSRVLCVAAAETRDRRAFGAPPLLSPNIHSHTLAMPYSKVKGSSCLSA